MKKEKKIWYSNVEITFTNGILSSKTYFSFKKFQKSHLTFFV